MSHSGNSSKAVDGNENGEYIVGSCTNTDALQPTWWQVDLLSVLTLAEIHIYNRVDCCSGRLTYIEILTSVDNSSFVPCASWNKTIPYRFTNSTVKLVTVLSCQDRRARWVKVAKTFIELFDSYLTLCEVKIFESKFIIHI